MSMINKPTGLYPDNEAISLGEVLNDNINIFTTKNKISRSIIDNDGIVVVKRPAECLTSVTDYISVKGSYPYKFSGGNAFSSGIPVHAWYRRDKTFISISRPDYDANPIVIAPQDAAFIRIQYTDYGTDDQSSTLRLRESTLYENSLVLSCQLLSGSDIETFTDNNDIERACVTLIVWEKDRYYHFYFGENSNSTYAPRVVQGEYSTEVRFDIDEFDQIEGYCYEKPYQLIRKKDNVPLSNVVRSGKDCLWKLRFYDKGSLIGANNYAPYNVVGYGTTDKITSATTKFLNQSSAEVTDYTFRTFTHQNIYDADVIGGFTTDKTQPPKSISDYPNISDTIYNVLRCCDDNIKYWFVSRGYVLPFDKYRFYEYTGKEEFNNTGEQGTHFEEKNNLSFDNDFDEYGNPFHGYVIIQKAVIESADESLDTLGNVENEFEQETYSIKTNYVDSNWACFTIYEEPEIEIVEDGSDERQDGAVITLTHSSIDLTLSVSQSQGLGVDYYSYKIYSQNMNVDTDWRLDYSSGNVYDKRFNIYYDRLFNNKTYKVVISIVDTAKRVFERTLYYKTNFGLTVDGLFVDAQYYRPHNSIIVDWSEVNSINPIINISTESLDYVQAGLTNNEVVIKREGDTGFAAVNALYLHSGSTLTYFKNDFGVPLSFDGSTLTAEFYGTDMTNGTILEFGSDNGFAARVSYSGWSIIITTTKNRYIYPLYPDWKISGIADMLEGNEPSGEQDAPIWWDDRLVWDDDYTWYTYNNIMAKWQIEISENSVKLTFPDGRTDRGRRADKKYLLDEAISSYLILHGDVIYDSITVEKDDETLMDCGFTNTANGIGSEMDFSNLRGWRVYKTMGETDNLYEVANTIFNTNAEAISSSRILEDFIVGDNVSITYYIYPIVNDNNGHNTIANPMITKPIFLQEGIDKVCSLNYLGDKTYEVNTDEVWRLHLGLEDSGFAFNTDKNFYDTFNKYNQETTGNRKYITKSVGGMIGYIDCSSGDEGVVDTYDMLVSWNRFSGAAGLKCFVDIRGLVLPGNFEANPSVEYEDVKEAYANVKFTWRQMADLDVIKIYGRLLPFNPTRGVYFTSSDGYYLSAREDAEANAKDNVLYTSNTN